MLKSVTHLALQPWTGGHCAHLVGQAKRVVLAPQSCQVLPSSCLQRWIFRLEMAGQEPVAKSPAVTLQCVGQREIWAPRTSGKRSPGGSPCREELGTLISFTLAPFGGCCHPDPAPAAREGGTSLRAGAGHSRMG